MNFTGLVVTFASFYAFCCFLQFMIEYNRCFDDGERIYRVEMTGKVFVDDSVTVPLVVAPLATVARTTEHVEDVAVLHVEGVQLTFEKKDVAPFSIRYMDGYGKDLGFWNSKIRPAVAPGEHGLLIPRSFAEKWFEDTNPLGQELRWQIDGESFRYKVVYVYDDFPENCNVKNAIYYYEANKDSARYDNYNYSVYVKLDRQANKAIVERQLWDNALKDKFGNDSAQIAYSKGRVRIILRPLHDTYFSRIDEMTDKGNADVLVIMLVSAVLVIVLMTFNYINFVLALTPFRVRNINTRRVFGASKEIIILGMIMESIMRCVAAFVVAIALVHLFMKVIDTDLSMQTYPAVFCLTLLTAVVVGLLVGIYAAWTTTSIPLAQSVNGIVDMPRRNRLYRTMRIAFQMLICFVACGNMAMLVIQNVYVYNMEYGYAKNRIMYATIGSVEAYQKKDSMAQLLTLDPDIKAVSFSRFALGTSDRYMAWSRLGANRDEAVMLHVFPVDRNYIETMGIELIEGRGFMEKDSLGAYIVNEAALKQYPWMAKKKRVFANDENVEDFPIVGVCRNVVFSSLRRNDAESPMVFLYAPCNPLCKPYFNMFNMVSIRLENDASVAKAKETVRRIYAEVSPSDTSVELGMMDEYLDNLYDNERDVIVLTSLFALLYVLITLTGISSVITFEGEVQRREMGVRRVFGASRWGIIFVRFRLYLLIVSAMFLLSIPIVSIVGSKMLQHMAIKSPHLWLAYPVAWLMVSAVVFGVILIHRYRYSREKPARILRNE